MMTTLWPASPKAFHISALVVSGRLRCLGRVFVDGAHFRSRERPPGAQAFGRFFAKRRRCWETIFPAPTVESRDRTPTSLSHGLT